MNCHALCVYSCNEQVEEEQKEVAIVVVADAVAHPWTYMHIMNDLIRIYIHAIISG